MTPQSHRWGSFLQLKKKLKKLVAGGCLLVASHSPSRKRNLGARVHLRKHFVSRSHPDRLPQPASAWRLQLLQLLPTPAPNFSLL